MKRKGMTLQKAWEQYRVQYPDGYQITSFYNHYRRYMRSSNPVMHMEHKAGDKMFIDYAGDKLHIVDEVFYHYERIALHNRDQRKYQYTTIQEHLASSHRFVSDWTPEKFIDQGKAIHQQVAEYLSKVLETKMHPEQAYKSCSGILNLARKVGNQRLVNACKRAMLFGVYNYPIILQILEKNLDHFSEEESPNQPMPQHSNIRGSEYYQ